MLQIQLNGQVFTVNGVISISPPAPTVPPVPTNIDISEASTTNNIIITWTNPGVAPDTNEIWKSTDGTTYAFYASVAGNVQTYSDTLGIGTNTEWFYKVQACNGAGCSALTAARSAARTILPPINVAHVYPSMVIHFGDLNYNSRAPLSISAPLLRKITGLLDFNSVNVITTASFPALKSVAGEIGASSCPILTTIDFSSLQSAAFIFFISDPQLTSASFPALVSCGTQFYTLGGTNCAHVSIGSWVIPNGTTLNCQNCKFPSADINAILARAVASGVTGCTIQLDGGTNGAPTGQGIADKATLQGAGNTVTTN